MEKETWRGCNQNGWQPCSLKSPVSSRLAVEAALRLTDPLPPQWPLTSIFPRLSIPISCKTRAMMPAKAAAMNAAETDPFAIG